MDACRHLSEYRDALHALYGEQEHVAVADSQLGAYTAVQGAPERASVRRVSRAPPPASP